MLNVIYSLSVFFLSVANKPIMPNVVMLNVAAPYFKKIDATKLTL